MTVAKITANVAPLVELDHGEVWTTITFASATGGREVPGVDPAARRLGGAR